MQQTLNVCLVIYECNNSFAKICCLLVALKAVPLKK